MNEIIRRFGKPLSLLSFSPGIMLGFVQKITFILRKIHKNCCHQSCSFWLKYAPNRLSDYSAPPCRGPTSKGEGGREGRRGEGREGTGGEVREGVRPLP